MRTTEIDRILQRSVLGGGLPGVVAFAANRDGVVYQGAFGCRAIDSNEHMTLDTVFWIASMSKAIVSVAAMQLVEKGKLQLDEPISSLLPELALVKVLEGFDADGLPQLREPKKPITLRHLLTHTSGLAYEFCNSDIIHYMEHEQIPSIISCKNVALKTPLVHDPGEQWEYGIGIDWVGKAIEAVSGQSLNDYLRDSVLSRLGMDDTVFILQPGARSRMAAMHQRDAGGSLIRIDFEFSQEPEFFSGGGGLYSTGGDYLKFLQMLLHGGTLNGVRILQPETVKEMGCNQIGNINVLPLKSAIPSLINETEFFPGMVKKWGLGSMITTEDAPTGRSGGSLAWAGLANSFFWIDPVKQITGVLLTQILPFGDERVMDLFEKFETAIYE